MLVLIASDELKLPAHAEDDVAVDGELVAPVVVPCGNPLCGSCPSAWFGLVSHRSTETAMVVERPGVTEADLRRRIHEWLDCQGVIDIVHQAIEHGEYSVNGEVLHDPVQAVADLVDDHVREIRLICASYAVGTVVSRFGTLVSECRLDKAA
jgi:hypothetical protein